MSRRTLLLVEDEPGIRFSIRRFFANKGYAVHEAGDAAGAEEAFKESRPDVAILDYCLPDRDGIELMRSLRAVDATVPIILLTAHGTIDLAVQAVKDGAEHFFTKPVELPALLVVVERVIENQRNRQVNLAGRSRQARQADPFLGESPAIRRLADQSRKVAGSSSAVLIQGETGTGKGLLANWLHQNGPRAAEAFVDLNCAGLSRELIETELFGHEKGAFTGAVASKPGLLDIGHRGTVFLDEIGDVDLQIQPKLLKVLDDQRFRRLGDVRDRQVDIRLIAATHQNLAAMVDRQAFRADLYYRINTLPIFVPPLRERGGDIVLLARELLLRIAADLGRSGLRLSPSAERAVTAHDWPGNVRELRNALERAVLLGDRSVIDAEDLIESLSEPAPAPPAGLTLREAERRHISVVLREQAGNVPLAAKQLGLSRSALYQKLRKHGIRDPGTAS